MTGAEREQQDCAFHPQHAIRIALVFLLDRLARSVPRLASDSVLVSLARSMSGYETQSPDTSRVSEETQFAIYETMQPWQKLQVVARLHQLANRLVRIDIRERHPDASDAEIRMRVAARRLDRTTMIQVYRWDPREHGC